MMAKSCNAAEHRPCPRLTFFGVVECLTHNRLLILHFGTQVFSSHRDVSGRRLYGRDTVFRIRSVVLTVAFLFVSLFTYPPSL